MFRLNNIKQNVLILSFATLLAGCGGGGTTTTDSTTTDSTTTDSTTTDSTTTTSTQKVVTVQTSELMITENSATIEWTPYGYITKSVEYGTDKKYGSEVLVQEEGTVTLSNLQANTEYHYRIISEDTNGRPVVSRDNTFTTLAATTQPIITDPIVTDPIVTDPVVTDQAPICQSGPAMQQGQVKDSISGTSLANVTVTINGCTTQTDAQGFYTLTNITVNDKAVVTFRAEGYYENSTIIQIDQYLEGTTDLSPNYTVTEMDKYISHWSYDSQTVVTGAHVNIPAGVYINNDGSPYIGQVTAGLSYRTSAEKSVDITFPGEYKGKDSYGVIIPFVSYGFTVIDITDENGVTLNVSEDITLIFEATGATENIIPLWYYDYLQGLWIEEGYATRQPDGTYKGTVSHPGTWSLSQPIQDASGIYTDRILYPDGTPVKNLRIHAVGDNWISTDLSTDENGVFEIEVIPGQAFTLKAYHYTDKYSAAYNGLISAVAPGDIVDNSSL